MLLVKIITFLMPWHIKRLMLIKFFNYEIHSSAKIGLSWIYPKKLIMNSNSKIGNFNIAVHLDLISIGKYSSISRGNWITGFPSNTNSKHFSHQKNREAKLLLGEHSAITKNHHIDCTSTITIGDFVTIAGYNSQLLTHSINILENRQDSSPITIGNYCFISTNVVILGGAHLPSYSVLGAKAMLNKKMNQEYCLYGGIPAKYINEIPKTAKYFDRSTGFIY